MAEAGWHQTSETGWGALGQAGAWSGPRAVGHEQLFTSLVPRLKEHPVGGAAALWQARSPPPDPVAGGTGTTSSPSWVLDPGAAGGTAWVGPW